MKKGCLEFVNRVELKSACDDTEWCIDIPNLKRIHSYDILPFLTELEAENADTLAAFIKSKAPWYNYEKTLPFTITDPLSIEDLRIASGTGNRVDVKELDLTAFQNLQTLCIEERCFLFVERVSILGLQHLKSINIGKFCFMVKYARVENSALSIKDCPSLDSIRIGGSSFRCYSSLEMESESELGSWSIDLPTLSSFVIDDGIERIGSFYNSPSFRFTGMSVQRTWWIDLPSLKTAFFGSGSFSRTTHVEISSEEWDGQWWIDLPKLELLHLSTKSLLGDKKNTKQEDLFVLHANELRMESWAYIVVLSHRLTIIEKNWSGQ